MKTIEIEAEQRPLSQLLAENQGEEVIYLTRKGQKQYALVPFDEMDEEVLAIRNNPELMAYLDECFRRAQTGPRIKLEDLKKELGLDGACEP
jgi:hypothetical protein